MPSPAFVPLTISRDTSERNISMTDDDLNVPLNLQFGQREASSAAIATKLPVPVEKGHWCDNPVTVRLLCVLCITAAYTIVELGFAIQLKSLVLLSDGVHNLSDVAAVGVAIYCNQSRAAMPTYKLTYGQERAEILGALSNAWFLVALSVFICIEAIQRFIDNQRIDTSPNFLYVAGSGVAVNFIGMLIAGSHGHGHSHGGHGHSHGGGHSHAEHAHDHGDAPCSGSDHAFSAMGSDVEESHDDHAHDHADIGASNPHGGHDDLNVRGVFLHYLGDTVSSLMVLFTGLVAYFVNANDFVLYYLDPSMSLLVVAIIMFTTIPLLRECSYIVLQVVPEFIDILDIKQHLLDIPGVANVHDLHVWALSSQVCVCSMHISVSNQYSDYTDQRSIVASARSVLHQFEIHSSSVEIELLAMGTPEFDAGAHHIEACASNCVDFCEAKWCCKNLAGSKYIPMDAESRRMVKKLQTKQALHASKSAPQLFQPLSFDIYGGMPGITSGFSGMSFVPPPTTGSQGHSHDHGAEGTCHGHS